MVEKEGELKSGERQRRDRHHKNHQLARFEGDRFYPNKDPDSQKVFSPTAIAELNAEFKSFTREQLAAKAEERTVAGRLINRRSNFLMVRDDSYTEGEDGEENLLQFYIDRKHPDATAENLAVIDDLNTGDLLLATGTVQRSGKGSLYLSIQPGTVYLLAKCLYFIPAQYYGLSDIETRHRQRYLDLMVNPQTRQRFRTRSHIVDGLRTAFKNKGFLEVETPMLQSVPSGANARSFATHHNALSQDMYLRIAPELHLKRLLIGGMGPVFELNRCFRNEGVSTRHNPEFTMLEFYQPFADYREHIRLIFDLIKQLAQQLNGTPVIHWQGDEYSLEQGGEEIEFLDAILLYNPKLSDLIDKDGLNQMLERDYQYLCNRRYDFEDEKGNSFIYTGGFSEWTEFGYAGRQEVAKSFANQLEYALNHMKMIIPPGQPFIPQELCSYCEAQGIKTAGIGVALLLQRLFEKTVETQLQKPTAITAYPSVVSPLARSSDSAPWLSERFELYIAGMEIANGFAELNDPQEQKRRFLMQSFMRQAGDDEAMQIDIDFLRALEYGMPPTAGAGIGVDRLVMLLTDSPSLREVLFFPHLRTKKESPDKAEPTE